MNRVGHECPRSPACPSLAEVQTLQAARNTGQPFAAGYSGARVNVYKALCRAGYLDMETGEITDIGREALARMEARPLKAAE